MCWTTKSSRLRPDALIQGLNLLILTDVMITSPTAPSHVSAAATTALATAALGERTKTSKYRRLAAEEKVRFVPFVLESFGAVGAQAARVIASLSSHLDRSLAHDTVIIPLHSFKHWAYRVLSVALQRGNARAVECAARAGHARSV